MSKIGKELGTPAPGWQVSVAVGFHLQVSATGRWSKSRMRGQVKAVVSNGKTVCPNLNHIERYQILRCRSCSPAGSHGVQDCPRWAAVVCSAAFQLLFEQNCVVRESSVRAGRVQLQLKSRAVARHPGGPKGATVHALLPSCGVQQRRVCLSQTRGSPRQ